MCFISCKTASTTSQHRVKIHYDRSAHLACVLIPYLRGVRSLHVNSTPPTHAHYHARGWAGVSTVFLLGWLTSAQNNEIPPGGWPCAWLVPAVHILLHHPQTQPSSIVYHPLSLYPPTQSPLPVSKPISSIFRCSHITPFCPCQDISACKGLYIMRHYSVPLCGALSSSSVYGPFGWTAFTMAVSLWHWAPPIFQLPPQIGRNAIWEDQLSLPLSPFKQSFRLN